MIDDIINFMFENKIKKLPELRTEVFQGFFKWFVEVMKEGNFYYFYSQNQMI